MAAFGDLNLPYQSDPRILMRFISSLVNLGYETVAINKVIAPSVFKKGHTEKIPFPPDFSKLPGLTDLKKLCPRLKLLSRITIVVDDQSQLRYVSGEAVQSYDIVSVQPMNEKLFQQVSQTVETDIISFDMTSRLPFHIKLPQVNVAIERGISFEIAYSPAIRDETLRKNVISNGLDLVLVCKGKHVVVTSGAEYVMELRGPYDIVNLGLLFGLKQDQSKAAVCKNVRSAIYHAEARNRTAKGVIGIEKHAPSIPSAAVLKRAHENEGDKNTPTVSKKVKV